jgi:hypothetical protein
VAVASAADSFIKRASGAWTSEIFVLTLMSGIFGNTTDMHYGHKSKACRGCGVIICKYI